MFLLTMPFSHIISLLDYFTSEPPTCMQCMLGVCVTALECLWPWVAGPYPTLHPFLIYSDLCLHEHVMLGCTDICCISQLFCMLCCHFPHIFSLQYFIRLSSTWLKQKQISTFAYFNTHHCSAVACCSLSMYVCFAHSGNRFVFNMSHQVCHFISIWLIAVLF